MKVNFKKTLLMAGLLVTGGLTVQAQSPEVASAIKALDRDRLGSARQAFEKAATSAPSAENQFYLGYYYLRSAAIENEESGKTAELLQKAQAAFEKGLAADAKNQLNKVGLGGVKLAQGNMAEGKKLVDEALSASRNNENLMWRAAEMYTMFEDKGQVNDPAAAIALIDGINGMKRKTLRPEYFIAKGDAFLIKNDGGNAVSAYEEALRLNNDPAMAALIQTRIGKVFERGRNYNLTQEYYHKAIQADSTYAPAYWNFAELWLRAQNYTNAAAYLDKYIQTSEETPEVVLRYAKLAFEARQYQNVLDRLNKVSGSLPANDEDILRMSGWSNIATENYQPGVTSLEKLMQANPKKTYALDYRNLGLGYRQLKNDSMAYQSFAKAAETDTSYNNYDQMAQIRTDQKRWKEAAAEYQRSIDWKKAHTGFPVQPSDFLRQGVAYYQAVGENYRDTTVVQKDTTLITNAVTAFQNAKMMTDTLSQNPAYAQQKETINNLGMTALLYAARVSQFYNNKTTAMPLWENYIKAAEADTATNKKNIIEGLKYMGRVAYATDRTNVEKAKDYFRRVATLDPADADAQRVLGMGTAASSTSGGTTKSPASKTTTRKPTTSRKKG